MSATRRTTPSSQEPRKEVRLSESLEDYLEAIAELIAVEGHAHSKDIAAKLQVKMPSVTGALRQLMKLDYIVYNTHFPVELTPAGKAVADEVIRRHRILKDFFSGVLGLPLAKASEVACHIEHVVDADAIRRLVIFSKAIGRRSDARRLRLYLTEAMSFQDQPERQNWRLLTEVPRGGRVRVACFGRNLAQADTAGLQVDDLLTVEGASLDQSALRLEDAHGTIRELPLAVAENIWCKDC